LLCFIIETVMYNVYIMEIAHTNIPVAHSYTAHMFCADVRGVKLDMV
jgi:hypothetical protein